MKIIIGITGQIGTGKGTAAKYIEDNYNAANLRFSTMLRDVLDRLYLEQSRENMQQMSTMLRQTYGEDTLANVMTHDAMESEKEIVIIEGIRRMADIEPLKDKPEFHLLHIFADVETTYERVVARGENTGDEKKSLEEFKADHEQESELEIKDVAERAQFEIDNNGSFEDLHHQIDGLIKTLQQ